MEINLNKQYELIYDSLTYNKNLIKMMKIAYQNLDYWS